MAYGNAVKRAGVALAAFLLMAAPALAQSTNAALTAQNNTTITTNAQGLITGAVMRAMIQALINSLTLQTRTIASTTTDVATDTDYLINWRNVSAVAKAQTIPACSAANVGRTLVIADDQGTAGQYYIVVTPLSGTIGGTALQTIRISWGSMTIQCDGISNWNIE